MGYEAATLGRIARRAGVSVATVKAQGPKRELLVRAFELVFVGPDEQGATKSPDLPDDPEALLGRTTGFIADAYARTVRLWEAFVVAAGTDPEVRDEYVAMTERRRAAMRGLLAQLTARGVPRPFDLEHVLDVTELLYSHEAWRRFVEERGWSRERWVTWTVASTLAVMGGALP
ncbi:TetR family transcriptional regulator [Cellulomonas phragmiteti]|uniref:TetR family transcriptional regulator n=1 Tax=Cellulomonas phragmiteti TaxID=478780 RepID=A0ABQ4DN50_9CELL|nr:TetR family transcriptional regulator [Cellulomonas phragmiteti]